MRLALVILFATALPSQAEDDPAKAQRAADLVVAGKAEEAIPLFEDLVRSHPNDAPLLLNLTIAEFKAGRYRNAAVHASEVLKIHPESAAANLFLGSSYEELGEYSMAVGPLEEALAVQPRERNANLMLANALLNLERYGEAEARFRIAAELAPENPKVWYGLGRVYDALSEKVYRDFEAAKSDSPYWHALAANLYLRQRRYGSAFHEYQLAAHLNLAAVHAGLATIYARTGHTEWAAVERKREGQAAPDCRGGGPACDFAGGRFGEIIRSAASSTGAENQYWAYKAYVEMARQAYERLVRLPLSLEAHLHRASMLDREGQSADAAIEWDQALKLAPADEGIRTSLAWSLFRAHEFDAALPVLQELVQKHPASRDLNFLYGATLLNLDRPGDAIRTLEAAVRIDGRFSPAHAALGRAFLQISKPELAIPHLQAALDGDEDASVHFALLRAYELSGQTGLAQKSKVEYQRALALLESKQRIEEGAAITGP